MASFWRARPSRPAISSWTPDVSETERIRVGALVSVLVLLVPGFLIHEAPRFPGGLIGSAFGIAGALLLVLLLIYSIARRSVPVKALLSRQFSMRALLVFHIYAGVIGALFGIVHSGHAFRSPMGVALVATMLVVVLSGFAGHYTLVQSGVELKDRQAELATLRARYASGANDIRSSSPDAAEAEAALPKLLAAMAETEHRIGNHEALKKALSKWTVLHIAMALVMYSLLAVHIWNGIYFGLRWLR